jgi:hypothetical protein
MLKKKKDRLENRVPNTQLPNHIHSGISHSMIGPQTNGVQHTQRTPRLPGKEILGYVPRSMTELELGAELKKKKARHRRSRTVGFRFQEVPGVNRCPDTESRMEGVGGGMGASGQRGPAVQPGKTESKCAECC